MYRMVGRGGETSWLIAFTSSWSALPMLSLCLQGMQIELKASSIGPLCLQQFDRILVFSHFRLDTFGHVTHKTHTANANWNVIMSNWFRVWQKLQLTRRHQWVNCSAPATVPTAQISQTIAACWSSLNIYRFLSIIWMLMFPFWFVHLFTLSILDTTLCQRRNFNDLLRCVDFVALALFALDSRLLIGVYLRACLLLVTKRFRMNALALYPSVLKRSSRRSSSGSSNRNRSQWEHLKLKLTCCERVLNRCSSRRVRRAKGGMRAECS